MEAMTFNSLLTDLRRYLERAFTEESDPIVYDQLPRLITNAERRIARELKIEGFVTPVETTLQVGLPVYAKPDRWRDTISMRIVETGSPIFARSYEYARNYWPNEAVTGTPAYYADYDYEHWLLVPTPAAAITVEILYYQQPPFLGDDVQTNWLTKYIPDALLYSALLESEPFLKNDQRIAVWEGMLNRAMSSINGEDLKRIVDRAAVRSEA